MPGGLRRHLGPDLRRHAGGGAAGAYEAGVIDAYYRALEERPEAEQDGLRPAFIIGTSAGALNAVTMLLDALEMGHPAIPREEPRFGARS